MCWHAGHCFTPCAIWKPHRLTCDAVYFGKEFELAFFVAEGTKNISGAKGLVQLITSQQQDGWKNCSGNNNFDRSGKFRLAQKCRFRGCAPRHWGESGEKYSENIRRARLVIVQWGWSPSCAWARGVELYLTSPKYSKTFECSTTQVHRTQNWEHKSEELKWLPAE